MKQVVINYTFNTSAKTITLSDFSGSHPVDLKRLYLITDVTTNKILYNFADSTVTTASISSNNVITLGALQGGESNFDSLQIIYEVLATDPTYEIPLLPSNASQETGGNLATIASSTSTIASTALATTTVQTNGSQKTLLYDGTNTIGTSSHPVQVSLANTGANSTAVSVSDSSSESSLTTIAGAVASNKVNVNVSSGTVSANQGGTWTVQPGNTANTVPWLVTSDPELDTTPVTQNISAGDSSTSSTAQQNGQTAITGSPTSNSAATFSTASLETASIQITGTWSGTLVSEFSIDNGTTYFSRGIHIDGTNYAASTFTANVTGGLNLASVTNLRVRCTAYTSGTATVKLVGSVNPATFYLANSPQIADGTTPSQKLAINASGQITEANSAGILSDLGTLSGTVGSGKVNVNISSSSATNQSTNIAQVGGNTVVTGGANGSQGVGGLAASGSALTGNPVLIGGSNGTNAYNLKTDTSGQLYANQAGTWTVQPGNTPNTTAWLVQQAPATSGGLSAPATGSIGNTATAVKTSAGQVYGWYFYNNNSVMSYVQFYNTATGSVTVGTTSPIASLGVPPNGGANLSLSIGWAFSTAITIAITTTRSGGTSPTNTVDYNVWYD